jgi:predicted nucleotidyltransferase component of viral defense system
MHPDLKIAKKSLPAGLLYTIKEFFSDPIDGVMLVGGTAISGFYTAHRRSDDIDLFSKDVRTQEAAIYRIKNFNPKKIKIEILENYKEFFHAIAHCMDHQLTIQVVLDSLLYKIAKPHQIEHLNIASLEILYKMKIATLVSRCSEKDLSDVMTLKKLFPEATLKEWIEWGHEIDGGVSPESLELSLTGASLKIEACNFSLTNTKPKDIYKEINQFRKDLIMELKQYIKKMPADDLGKLFKVLK